MISWCIIGTTTHSYFWRWKFAKGDSNCCIFIPYVAMFCLTQSCIWYHLAKNPAHVPSNQAINKQMGKKKKQNNDILSTLILWNTWNAASMLYPLNCTNYWQWLYWSLKGCLIVKCFSFLYFSLQRGVKDVCFFFFFTQSWSTRVYLRILVQTSKGNGGKWQEGDNGC